MAFEKDTPGLPTIDEWKHYIVARVQLNRDLDSIICGVSGFLDHLSEDEKRDLMFKVNNPIWGAKLCTKSGEMVFISSLQFEMYQHIPEDLIIEAIVDLAGCADKLHEFVNN